MTWLERCEPPVLRAVTLLDGLLLVEIVHQPHGLNEAFTVRLNGTALASAGGVAFFSTPDQAERAALDLLGKLADRFDDEVSSLVLLSTQRRS